MGAIPRAKLSAVLAATATLAVAACGSSESADDAEAGAVAVRDAPSVDYSELRTYDCDYLEGLLDKVIGPGDHEGIPDESWSVEGDLQASCAFTDPVMTVRIELAKQDEHTLEWTLAAPETAAEREELAVDVGDEGYLEDDGRTLVLMVRKGLIEMRLTGESEAADPVTADELIAVAHAILRPWPSGEGAQESEGAPEPPDIPLPPGILSEDLEYFDVEQLNANVERAAEDGAFPDVRTDPDLVPTTFTVSFDSSPAQIDAYCHELREFGIDLDLSSALAEEFDASSDQAGERSGKICQLTDEDIVVSVNEPIGDSYLLTVTEWDGLIEQICRSSTEC